MCIRDRLDRSIASLLDIIDKKVGLQNVVFFITSTGYTDTESPDQGLYRVPTGEFHLNRCAALLNMYLMAVSYTHLVYAAVFAGGCVSGQRKAVAVLSGCYPDSGRGALPDRSFFEMCIRDRPLAGLS